MTATDILRGRLRRRIAHLVALTRATSAAGGFPRPFPGPTWHHGREVPAGHVLGADDATPEALAAWVAGNVRAMVDALVPENLRVPVLDREPLALRFPLDAGPDRDPRMVDAARGIDCERWVPSTFAVDQAIGRTHDEHGDGMVWFEPLSNWWPRDAAPGAVLDALRESGVPEARAVAEYFEGPHGAPLTLKEWRKVPKFLPFMFGPGGAGTVPPWVAERFAEHPLLALARQDRMFTANDGPGRILGPGEPQDWTTRPATEAEALQGFMRRMCDVWNPRAVAVVLDAVREVQRDRVYHAVALDSGNTHRSLIDALRDSPRDNQRRAAGAVYLDEVDGRVVLLAPRGTPMQLSLPGDNWNEEIARSFRKWRGHIGPRHWCATQYLLSVDGERSGEMTWRLNRALDVLHYARRDRAKREETIELMLFQTKVELLTQAPDGRKRHVAPLLANIERIDVLSGTRWETEGIRLRIHRALYSGVRNFETGDLGENFYPATPAGPTLDHNRYLPALFLWFVLPTRWRLAWREDRDKGYCAMTGANLLRAAGIQYNPARPSTAWSTLRRNLEALQRLDPPGLGRVEWDGPEWRLDSVCRLYAPQWSKDRTVHGLRAIERPLVAVPVIGADVAALRAARGLSQEQLATAAGLSRRTVIRAEAAKDRPLTTAMQRALETALGLPGARGLGNPPGE